MFRINHLHLKSRDPKASADWFVQAFNFQVLTDEQRSTGDRFVRCLTEDGGMRVFFSGERDGEVLHDGATGVHLGIEHIGIDTADVVAHVERLQAMGARLIEGPRPGVGSAMVAFVETPDGIRIELMQPK
ncbi:VOC family protein [Sinorhizobium mexicanum]|uniref:VOC family protein n=1 Tax=Sinorhizobium mexicanum TaxID=375549 RepID=A0A859QM89_9HYPH|nr:VOC family protein [Sinorhizobium mexicanum]MBP1883775.1 lactoylglutathione lyase [Sinorhizobium mexicanum]QLL62947.1 VOC family protein [Sinorhizobium mexicanum]